MEKIPNNIEELRNSLTQNYSKILSGELIPKVAKEVTNTAGKIINTCKIQMDYNKELGIKKEIPFLEVN